MNVESFILNLMRVFQTPCRGSFLVLAQEFFQVEIDAMKRYIKMYLISAHDFEFDVRF